MRWLDRWNDLFVARTMLLLPPLLLSLSLQALAQASGDDKQTAPGTNQNAPNRPEDYSKWPALVVAAQGGGGWSSNPAYSSAYAGVKIGLTAVTLDLGYDRVPQHNGFSTEVSAMLPVFRFPGPQKDETKNFLRVYAEPGLGYRAGGGVGGYASTKVMMVLFSDRRLTSSATKWSPYIEVQRRFPLDSPSKGDTRITFGMMFAICEHCGLD
jgi:hypothetical protein